MANSKKLSNEQVNKMMTNSFKFIIVDTGAILFNEKTTHADVAKGFKKVYSAGFCYINMLTGEVGVTDMGSESLKLEPQPAKDKEIIEDLFTLISKIKYLAFSVENHYK